MTTRLRRAPTACVPMETGVRMRVVSQALSNGAYLELSFAASNERRDADAFTLLIGAGRGCRLQVAGPVAGIWMPLHGRLQLTTASGSSTFARGDLLVSEPELRVQAIGRGAALWVALLGGRTAWRRALETRVDGLTPDPLLIPARHAADRVLRRRVLALARAARKADAIDASVIFDALVDLQNTFEASIGRCPGRTYAQRRQVFLRLQRVRNYMATNCHLDLATDDLARMASYSPWHLIRAFNAAYGETPHVFLVRQRLDRARRLLRASPLAIAEIALASGFENRCAFSRLFRQSFGISASALRRQWQPALTRVHAAAAVT